MKKEVKIIKRKICEKEFLLGYWKGGRVALVPKYHPDANPDEYVIKEVEMLANDPFPKLIDPETTPLSIIREICEFNDRPFGWVTGIYPDNQGIVKIEKGDSIQNAIEYFIALGTASTTSTQYRRIFNDLIKEGIIEPSLKISFYLNQANNIEELVLKFSTDRNYNEKISNILQSFYRFIREGKISVKKTGNGFYKSKVKVRLKKEDAKAFFKALKSINPVHELVARILWFLNNELAKNPEEGPMVFLEEVLKLKEENISNEPFACTVSFFTRRKTGTKLFATYLPEDLFERVQELSERTDMFIFRTKKGSPIDPSQIRRSFIKASKLAKLPMVVTPIHLRNQLL